MPPVVSVSRFTFNILRYTFHVLRFAVVAPLGLANQMFYTLFAVSNHKCRSNFHDLYPIQPTRLYIP